MQGGSTKKTGWTSINSGNTSFNFAALVEIQRCINHKDAVFGVIASTIRLSNIFLKTAFL